eukprot:3822944-Prymnesium_polylepis.1
MNTTGRELGGGRSAGRRSGLQWSRCSSGLRCDRNAPLRKVHKARADDDDARKQREGSDEVLLVSAVDVALAQRLRTSALVGQRLYLEHHQAEACRDDRDREED